jgi:hypothetical protein
VLQFYGVVVPFKIDSRSSIRSVSKRDGRTLDHRTLEEIRRMAVQRVWDGERPNEATPQTDEMYSGCRDRDRITGLSGPG